MSEEDLPRWQRTHQDRWYYGASIHADNTPRGTPMWARQVWDEIIQIDPDAPSEYRPFWSMKSGGQSPLTDNFFDEIIERREAGYRVIYTLKNEDATPSDLRTEVEKMAARGALPWGVGLWNELDFGDRYSPEEFAELLHTSRLPEELGALHEDYGLMVSPPGIASFSHIILDGYGEVIKEHFSSVPGVFIKVHSYGHLQPKYWVEMDLKTRVQNAVAIPDVVVVIEETANGFVGEHSPPHAGVGDAQGAEFLRAAMYAGMQSQMPTCHFMLYHESSDWNNISDPVEGALRREAATAVIDSVRATNDIAPEGALHLENPKGREITEFSQMAE